MILLNEGERNSFIERIYIAFILLQYGIGVNIKNGRLFYLKYSKRCNCNSLDLVRHGKTEAIENREFMSDCSANSRLSEQGVLELKNTAEEINKISPEVILVAPIERTIKTFEILESSLICNPLVKECKYMVGINNSVWGDKRLENLDLENLYIFLERECNHNIFVKSKKGDSWGDVLVRCARLLKELNHDYSSKKVLLVSQGSIYQGLKILLHQGSHPWADYTASSMFGTVGKEKLIGYGKVLNIV